MRFFCLLAATVLDGELQVNLRCFFLLRSTLRNHMVYRVVLVVCFCSCLPSQALQVFGACVVLEQNDYLVKT